jgi:hypothetical protein
MAAGGPPMTLASLFALLATAGLVLLPLMRRGRE